MMTTMVAMMVIKRSQTKNVASTGNFSNNRYLDMT